MFVTDSSSAVSLQWPLTGQIQTQRWEKKQLLPLFLWLNTPLCLSLLLSFIIYGPQWCRSGQKEEWIDGCMDRWLCGRGTLEEGVDGYKKIHPESLTII